MKVTKIASAVRNATFSQNITRDVECCGVEAVLDVTAVPGVDTVTLQINWRDSVSGKSGLILAAAARVAVGTDRIRVYPGLPAAANLTANDVVPDEYQIAVVHSAGSNFSYSLKISELPGR